MSPFLETFGFASSRGYRSANGGAAGSYELISTTLVTSTVMSVSFSSIAQTYKHLQIRYTLRGAAAYTGLIQTRMRFNGATGAVYSRHGLYGSGSVVSYGNASQTGIVDDFGAPNNSNPAGIFAAGIIDVLDYAATTKFKTARMFTGSTGAGDFVKLASGSYQALTAVTSVTIDDPNANNGFIAGSRFSLYGIKG